MLMAKGEDTRTRILDAAQDAILHTGFDATSIGEIVAAAEITKGGFFYHFPDKNALALALIERYIAADDSLFDELFGRAEGLNDDPLQRVPIGLQLMTELLDDLLNGHPSSMVASAVYQDRLFDRAVREKNRQSGLGLAQAVQELFRCDRGILRAARCRRPRCPGPHDQRVG